MCIPQKRKQAKIICQGHATKRDWSPGSLYPSRGLSRFPLVHSPTSCLLSPLYPHMSVLSPCEHWDVGFSHSPGGGCHAPLLSSSQKPQQSPGAQSSCSSDHSPAGSAANTDSGVEMTGTAGGSTEDLSSLDEGPSVAGTGLSTLHRLENLRLDQLHQLRPIGSRGLKLPSLTHAGETWVWEVLLSCGSVLKLR